MDFLGKPSNFFIIVLFFSFGCKKDKIEDIYPINSNLLTLVDSLVGDYYGYRYYLKEEIYCPNGIPPCYDTVFVQVKVIKKNNDSVQIIDYYDGYCNRIIPMNGTLNYNGFPLQSAPEGFYKLNFNKTPHDSLFLDLMSGGGNSSGGVYYFYDYILRKQ